MHKYKLWVILALIVLGIGAVLFWLAPSQTIADPTNSTQAIAKQDHFLTENNSVASIQAEAFIGKSQQDTTINCQLRLDQTNRLIVNEQTRNCFEYFITQYGEKDLKKIKADFQAYIEQNHQEPARAQILDLWNGYIDSVKNSVIYPRPMWIKKIPNIIKAYLPI